MIITLVSKLKQPLKYVLMALTFMTIVNPIRTAVYIQFTDDMIDLVTMRIKTWTL